MFIKNFLRLIIRIILVFNCFLAFSQASGNTPDYHVFIENGKQGVMDKDNSIIIPAEYDKIGWSDSGFEIQSGVLGYSINDQWGLINTNNKIITPPKFEGLSIVNTGIYIKAGKLNLGAAKSFFGLISSKGETVIEFHYSNLEVINERVVAFYPSVNNISRAGLLSMEGKVLIPFTYLSLKPLGLLRYAAEIDDGKYMLYSDSGERVASVLLDSIHSFKGDYAKIWDGHKVGLINRKGEIVIEPNYKDIQVLSKEIIALDFDSWHEIDSKNQLISEFKYDNITRIRDTIFLVEANQKKWLIDPTNQVIGTAILDSVQAFETDLAVVNSGGRWGVLKTNGKWLLKPVYKKIQRRNGFFNTSDQRNRWRVFDKYGVEKTKGVYDEIGDYQKLHFPVRKGQFWGLISRTGDQVVNCVFDSLGSLSYDRLEVKFKNLYGIIDSKGNWLVTPDSYKKSVVNDFIYLENRPDQSILKRYDGTIVYFTNNPIEIFDDYFIERLSNGKVWKINFSGVIQTKELTDIIHQEPVIYSEFEDIFRPSEGLVGIRKDGKYGFVDDQNRLRIANRYDSIKSFHEQFAAIKLIGKWGFIDKDENLRIQPVYDWVNQFEGGICVVRMGKKYFLINKEAKLLFTSGFDNLKTGKSNRYLVEKDEQFGLVAQNGRMLVNYIYDDLNDLDNGLVIIKKLGRYGVVDLGGVNIIPRIYDDLKYDHHKDRFFGKVKSEYSPVLSFY